MPEWVYAFGACATLGSAALLLLWRMCKDVETDRREQGKQR
jgi:hypothetical protein